MRVEDRKFIAKLPFQCSRDVQVTIRERKGNFKAKQTNLFAYMRWMRKYHIIFITV